MPNDCISYQETGYFSPLINDYLNHSPELKKLYNRFPTVENFADQIDEKLGNYDSDARQILVKSLNKQYQNLTLSPKTQNHITALSDRNTFTVTTGHQLNLFTGPLYFLYKIVTAINLAAQLQQKYPAYQFVPVYWMATEDHDFEEINHFNFKGKKFRWNREASGAVGRLNLDGLDHVYAVFEKELGMGASDNYIRTLFKNAYLQSENLASATRFVANELFGKYGLVIIDADEQALKKLFLPYLKQELMQRTASQKVSETVEMLGRYSIQVNPREINLFYMSNGSRERIILENGRYKINNTSLEFTEHEMVTELNMHPEKFSPNVILRPLYQEVVLPNLCYIGGGGELAYWLELKSMFESASVAFPILMLRNSALLVSEKQREKADKLSITWKDLFLKKDELARKKTQQLSEFPISLDEMKAQLQKQFKELYQLVAKTDPSFSGAVKAQEAKQTKGLENLEKRLLKAQRLKYADEIGRVLYLQQELFPNGSLQERFENFSSFFIASQNKLIEDLLANLDPFSSNFEIITV